jgi:hypothetical protein
LLNLKTSTPSCMLYGELGRYPLNITVKLNILSFWSKLIDGSNQNYYLWSIDYCIWKFMEIILFHGLILLNQYLMTVDNQMFKQYMANWKHWIEINWPVQTKLAFYYFINWHYLCNIYIYICLTYLSPNQTHQIHVYVIKTKWRWKII